VKNTEQTKILLHQALGLDTRERTVMLEGIADSTIRSQLETLLADEAEREAFLANNPEATDQQPTPDIEPGALINRIRIIKALGQGGMGTVYLGFDEKLERQVAIKAIRPEHLRNPATQQRFVREAQILSKINHPSICQLYDYLETDAGDFLVLEYIKGQPLNQVPLDHTDKLKLMADLAGALAVAHEHGIVHRDLKPDNIMITQHGSLVGTIRYMSPEQARGEAIDTASDLYALGIIAQEVFSHQAAYQVMETQQLLTDVQQGKRQEDPELPAELADIIAQLTQLKPAQRPDALNAQTMFQNALDAPRRKRMQQLKWATISVLVLLAGLWWQWSQLGSQAERAAQVSADEQQINSLVKQAENIYVLPAHPVNQAISSILQEAEALYGNIAGDRLLTAAEKSRLMG
jgi:tRNA A-37 threonylcarbamoyl transferase component Bud32